MWNWPTVVESFSILCFAASVAARVFFSLYYRYSRSMEPDLERQLIYPYQVNGRTIFLKKWEKTFITRGLNTFAILFWLTGLIAAIGLAISFK